MGAYGLWQSCASASSSAAAWPMRSQTHRQLTCGLMQVAVAMCKEPSGKSGQAFFFWNPPSDSRGSREVSFELEL